MVRCFDRCNLIKSWKPKTKRDWLFEETWRCKVTGERVEQYYFKQKEREGKHYEKQPKLHRLFRCGFILSVSIKRGK